MIHSATPDSWSPGSATVELHVQQQNVDVVGFDGQKKSQFKAGAYAFIVTLTHTNAWLITRWQRLEP